MSPTMRSTMIVATLSIRGLTNMLIYFIILCCLPIFGLVTGVVVLGRSHPQRLAYSIA
jgi:hypothetical protein